MATEPAAPAGPPADSTPPGAPRFQRRTVLVKKTLQLKVIALVIAPVVLATVIMGGDIFFSMYRIVLRENPQLTPLLQELQPVIVVKLAIYLAIIVIVSMFVSHRFAGPVYRFERSAQTVAGGDLTHRVALRAGDELLELQDEFNQMVAALQNLVQRDRELGARIAKRLDTVAAGLPEAQREELKAIRAEVEHITSGFKA